MFEYYGVTGFFRNYPYHTSDIYKLCSQTAYCEAKQPGLLIMLEHFEPPNRFFKSHHSGE